jgi:hypothetical protein
MDYVGVTTRVDFSLSFFLWNFRWESFLRDLDGSFVGVIMVKESLCDFMHRIIYVI